MSTVHQVAAPSNLEWRSYGKRDCGASHDLSAGLAEWAVLKVHLAQYGLRNSSQCVEIGCGGGRLTNALATDFAAVQALDVSHDRIQQASRVPNASKIRFHLVDGPPIPLPDNSCNLAISTHVFQHIARKKTIEEYFKDIYRVLEPEGVMLVHLPVIGAHGRTGELGEVFIRRLKEIVKSIALPVARLFCRFGIAPRILPLATYRVFAWSKVAQFLDETGFDDIQLRILPWGGWHSYVFARKTATS